MERETIVPKQPRSMQDSFMPRPDYCERGTAPIFHGVVCVDTVICEYLCTRDCPAYRDYVRIGILAKIEKKKKKLNKRKSLDLGKRRKAITF